jgi:large subunit ribosomal protein L21
MYAVISSGGKQYRVEEGQQLAVERLGTAGEVDLAPVLVVDGDRVLATPDQLAAASVRARVIGDSRGPKIDGFTYKPKSNNRRRYGHRQDLSVIEIVGITPAGK